MFKFLFFLLSLFFFLKNYWFVQNCLIVLLILFMYSSMNFFSLMKLNYFLGMDLVSFMLIMLSIWILILMVMASFIFYKMNYFMNLYLFSMLSLLLLLVLTFSVTNLFMFYLFFESSLIPVLLMIFGWGYQCERLEASLYLLFYTLFVSLPLMGGIFFIFNSSKNLFMFIENMVSFNSVYLYLIMIFAFLIKLPMVFFHIWLPKAHVEAPVAGSMILAGVMLKLGGYGLIRILSMFQKMGLKFSSYFVSLSLLGGLYLCVLCLHQVDFKKLVAYSSVVHMGLFLGGLMTLSNWGMMGCFFMLLGHGLCSSGMFGLINLNYERLFSRSLIINKGLMKIMPSLSLWWFLLISSNMASPMSMNLISEISIINSLMSYSLICVSVVIFLFFFSGLYNLYLFMCSQHGAYIFLKNNFFSISLREFMMLSMHWIPLNMYFMKLDLFMLFL